VREEDPWQPLVEFGENRLRSAYGYKQTLSAHPWNVRFTPNSRHRNVFMTEDGVWDQTDAKRRRSHTNPEKRGVSNL